MKWFALSLMVLVIGCHERRPPAPTAEQNAELNDAENMLNAAAKQEASPAAPRRQ